MRHLRSKRLPAIILMVLLLMAMAMPGELYAKEEICQKAFEKCFVDAIIAGILGGVEAGIGYGAWCSVSYIWCVKYVESEE